MSWSISLIGTPDKVKEALSAYSQNISGQSKLEYDAVLPALLILADQNFDTKPCVIKINANGHGSGNAEQQFDRYCNVQLERVYGLLV